MIEYRVSLKFTTEVFNHYVVEAENEEEAKLKAEALIEADEYTEPDKTYSGNEKYVGVEFIELEK